MFLHFAGAPKSPPEAFLHADALCDERPDMTTHVHQFMCLQDNFGVLIHDFAIGRHRRHRRAGRRRGHRRRRLARAGS